MLQISHLRCFVTVATELHFGRAAQRLNMTQAPLSRQIQALEHTLGLSLFFRDRRAVQLTPAGVGFLPEARDILLRCELAMIAARRAAKGEAGTVRLGFIAAARFKVFPVIVSEASKSLSSINIELKDNTGRVRYWHIDTRENTQPLEIQAYIKQLVAIVEQL